MFLQIILYSTKKRGISMSELTKKYFTLIVIESIKVIKGIRTIVCRKNKFHNQLGYELNIVGYF